MSMTHDQEVVTGEGLVSVLMEAATPPPPDLFTAFFAAYVG